MRNDDDGWLGKGGRGVHKRCFVLKTEARGTKTYTTQLSVSEGSDLPYSFRVTVAYGRYEIRVVTKRSYKARLERLIRTATSAM